MWKPRARRAEGVRGEERMEMTSRWRDESPPREAVTAVIALGMAWAAEKEKKGTEKRSMVRNEVERESDGGEEMGESSKSILRRSFVAFRLTNLRQRPTMSDDSRLGSYSHPAEMRSDC